MKLYHFYHIYADGNWLRPLWQHFRAVKKSRLDKSLEKIFFGIVGTEKNRRIVVNFLNFFCYLFSLKYHIINQENDGWEQVTLEKLHEFSLTNDGYVLYAHTKGASYNKPPIPAWRKAMIRFNVSYWKEAVEKLKNYQAVGCYWVLPGQGHIDQYFFAGNFWWTHLSLLRTLEKPSRKNRYEAELWIGQKYKTHSFPVYDLHPVFPHIGIFGIFKVLGKRIKKFAKRIGVLQNKP